MTTTLRVQNRHGSSMPATSDANTSGIILDKLGQFDRLVDHVALTDLTRMSQDDLIKTLKELFRDKVPITRHRIEILLLQ